MKVRLACAATLGGRACQTRASPRCPPTPTRCGCAAPITRPRLGGCLGLGVVKLHGALDQTGVTGIVKLKNSMLGLSAPLGKGRLQAWWLCQRNGAVRGASDNVVDLGVRHAL